MSEFLNFSGLTHFKEKMDAVYEKLSNKVSSITDSASTVSYPSNKAVVDYVSNHPSSPEIISKSFSFTKFTTGITVAANTDYEVTFAEKFSSQTSAGISAATTTLIDGSTSNVIQLTKADIYQMYYNMTFKTSSASKVVQVTISRYNSSGTLQSQNIISANSPSGSGNLMAQITIPCREIQFAAGDLVRVMVQVNSSVTLTIDGGSSGLCFIKTNQL